MKQDIHHVALYVHHLSLSSAPPLKKFQKEIQNLALSVCHSSFSSAATQPFKAGHLRLQS